MKNNSNKQWNGGILLKGTTSGLPLMESLLLLLCKSTLIPLGLSVGMSAADAAVQNKIYRSGHPLGVASLITVLIISNEEMEDITKIVKSLAESALIIKGLSETIKIQVKE